MADPGIWHEEDNTWLTTAKFLFFKIQIYDITKKFHSLKSINHTPDTKCLSLTVGFNPQQNSEEVAVQTQ